MSNEKISQLSTVVLFDSDLFPIIRETSPGSGAYNNFKCLLPAGVAGSGSGFFSINSAVDFTISNPCPTNIQATFTAPNQSIILPVMNAVNSLSNQGVGRIYVYNNGTNTFSIKRSSGSVLYASVLSGQFLEILVDDNSTANGVLTVHDLTSQAIPNSLIPYGSTFPQKMIYDPDFKYDDSLQALYSKYFVGHVITDGDGYLSISSAVDVSLNNPCPTFIDASFSANGKKIILPQMDQFNSLNNKGVGRIFIKNSGSDTFSVSDNSSSITVATINPGEFYMILIIDNSSSDGQFSSVLLAPVSDYGVTKGFLSISQGSDYTMTNPTSAKTDVDFLGVSDRTLFLPPMNQINSPLTPFTITNVGLVSFILKTNGGNIFYTQLLPGQTLILYPKDFSSANGDFDILNQNIPPIIGCIPYAVTGGSSTLSTDPLFSYDDFSKTLHVPNILSSNTITGFGYVELTSGFNVSLSNPMYTFINVTNSGSGISLTLPPMNQSNSLKNSPLGIFYIKNSGSDIVIVRNDSGIILTTVFPGQTFFFQIKSNATAAGDFLFYNVSPISLGPQELGFGPLFGTGVSSSADLKWDDTAKQLILTNSTGAAHPGLILPNPTTPSTSLDTYSDNNIFIINVDGPWGTKTLSVDYTRIGNVVFFRWGDIAGDIVGGLSKIQSQNAIPPAFQPPESTAWSVKVINGPTNTSVSTGDFYLDSSFKLLWTAENNNNFNSTYAGILAGSVSWII